MNILNFFKKEIHRLPLRNGRRHGWIRDHLDVRDKSFCRLAPALPSSIDLRNSPFQPKIYDQGEAGSCVANGSARIYEFDQRKQGLIDYMPSRLAIYYWGRVLEHTVNQDSGLQIRDGIKVLARNGAPDERLFPYV